MSTCEVLGDTFSLLMQGVLLFCTCLVLVAKFIIQSGGRTWFEFLLDSSKQMFGAGWTHVCNLLCGVLFADELPGVDGCTWYAANICIDVTLGLVVEWLLLRAFQALLNSCRCRRAAALLKSGEYYSSEADFQWTMYVGQLCLWLLIVSIMKMSMVFLLQEVPFIVDTFNVALASFSQTPKAKLFVVMIAIPLLMNSFQFIMVDIIIKKRDNRVEDQDLEYSKLGGDEDHAAEASTTCFDCDEDHEWSCCHHQDHDSENSGGHSDHESPRDSGSDGPPLSPDSPQDRRQRNEHGSKVQFGGLGVSSRDCMVESRRRSVASDVPPPSQDRGQANMRMSGTFPQDKIHYNKTGSLNSGL